MKGLNYLMFAVGCLGLLFSACQRDSTLTNIKVDIASPAKANNKSEEILISNCHGNLELTSTLGSEKTIQKTIRIENTATDQNGSDHEISEANKLQLEIAIENAYQQIYENRRSKLENVEFGVPPGKETTYTIQWEQLTYNSNISFSQENEVHHIQFSYELMVPQLINKEENECNNPASQLTMTNTPEFATPTEISTTASATITPTVVRTAVNASPTRRPAPRTPKPTTYP
jgi:hypothetical protein